MGHHTSSTPNATFQEQGLPSEWDLLVEWDLPAWNVPSERDPSTVGGVQGGTFSNRTLRLDIESETSQRLDHLPSWRGLVTLRVGTAGTWVALPRGIHTVSLSVHITEGALGAPRPARSRHTHSGTQEMLGLIPLQTLGRGGTV